MIVNMDHIAFSPLLDEVREAMAPFLGPEAGNPLSKHGIGRRAWNAVTTARDQVASLINASPEEIVFTSCGSEANNTAVKGVAEACIAKGRHIISSPVEHHSVLHPLKRLERMGHSISWLSVDEFGLVDPQEVEELIRPDTVLITVTCASNEIGTIEPIKEIGSIAKAHGVTFHTDGVGCAGHIPLDVEALNVDLMSIASNTFYGPQGVAALYVRKGTRVLPLIEGGVQEEGLRAGTHNVAGIVGMGKAAGIARERLDRWREHLTALRDVLIRRVRERIADSILTGHPVDRLPGHASFCFPSVEGESLILHLDLRGFAVSSGSACASEAAKASYVLEAIGVDPLDAQGSVVFSLGIDNTIADVEGLMAELPGVVEALRRISPLGARKRTS